MTIHVQNLPRAHYNLLRSEFSGDTRIDVFNPIGQTLVGAKAIGGGVVRGKEHLEC